MESKYYTPKIEEFHVGFECYLLGSKLLVTNVHNLELFSNEPVLVKYLGKEDIEEILKTKQLKGDENDLNFQLHLSEYLFYEFDYDLEDKTLTVEEFTGDLECGFNSLTIFRGLVKNKSELKKLLTQLNIT